MSQKNSQFDYETFEPVDLDLAVVKAMSRAPLSLDEVDELSVMGAQELIAEQGLDYAQAEEVMKWARHEMHRHTAQHLSGLRVDDYESRGAAHGTVDPVLRERRSRKARKMSSRELRGLIAEVFRNVHNG
jgi:hypothetical protein|tara:strand:- start:222 stop:611 length:390 start_codon:yes stop_codon:yes gene_type:complete